MSGWRAYWDGRPGCIACNGAGVVHRWVGDERESERCPCVVPKAPALTDAEIARLREEYEAGRQ